MQNPSIGGIRGLALAAGLLALTVHAQEQGVPPPPVDPPGQGAEASPSSEGEDERKHDRLDRMDEESQGLWRDQMEGEAIRDLRTLDADRDGKLSRNEVRGDSTLHPLFDSLDLNQDDYLSQDEYRAGAAAAIRRAGPDDPT